MQILCAAGGTFPGLEWRSDSGYSLARMRYEIILSPQAIADFKSFPGATRAELRERFEVHLRHEPTKPSRSRIKRLRGFACPQFRLRVGEIRVFYDVSSTEVQILTIVAKAQAERWLQQHGEPS